MQLAQSTYDHTSTKRTTLRSQVHLVKNLIVWYEKNNAFQELVEKENCRVCDKLRRQTAAEKIPHLLRPKRNYLFTKKQLRILFYLNYLTC